MQKKIICPQCQEKKILLDLIYHNLKGGFQGVSMCRECYIYHKYLKKGFPRILYMRTSIK